MIALREALRAMDKGVATTSRSSDNLSLNNSTLKQSQQNLPMRYEGHSHSHGSDSNIHATRVVSEPIRQQRSSSMTNMRTSHHNSSGGSGRIVTELQSSSISNLAPLHQSDRRPPDRTRTDYRHRPSTSRNPRSISLRDSVREIQMKATSPEDYDEYDDVGGMYGGSSGMGGYGLDGSGGGVGDVSVNDMVRNKQAIDIANNLGLQKTDFDEAVVEVQEEEELTTTTTTTTTTRRTTTAGAAAVLLTGPGRANWPRSAESMMGELEEDEEDEFDDEVDEINHDVEELLQLSQLKRQQELSDEGDDEEDRDMNMDMDMDMDMGMDMDVDMGKETDIGDTQGQGQGGEGHDDEGAVSTGRLRSVVRWKHSLFRGRHQSDHR